MLKHVKKSCKKDEADKPVGYIVTENGVLVQSEESNSESRPRRKEHKSLLDSLSGTENHAEKYHEENQKKLGNKKLGGTQDLDCLSTQTCHLQERRRSSFNLDSSPGDGNVLTGRRRSSAARALGLVEAQLLDGKLRQFWAVVMVTRAVAAMSAPRRRRLVGMEKDPFFYNFPTDLHVFICFILQSRQRRKSKKPPH